MLRVIFNRKGGVGKSSITCNLAAVSAQQGQRTLVVDLDPQGNSTHYLLGKPSADLRDTIATFFDQTLNFSFDKKQIADLVYKTPFSNLDLLPSSPLLGDLEHKLESRYKIYKLRDALESLSGSYDRIFIDTPPALNFYTRSALIATDSCLIPFDCDAFSVEAMYFIMEAIQEIKEDHNQKLHIEGIIANHYHAQARHPRALIASLIEEGLPILPVYLTTSVKMRESHQLCKPVVYAFPNHKLSKLFGELYQVLDTSKQALTELESY